MSSSQPLPTEPSEVTPRWLTGALSERFPGTRVREVEVLEVHHGTNSNARLRVRYEGTPDLPATYFLKMLPLDPERRATIEQTGMGRREALFYRHLAHEVPMRVPRPYVAVLNEEDGAFVLLLEDLQPTECELADPRTGITVQQAADAMVDYAALHVRFEDAPTRRAIAPWVTHMEANSDMGIWMLQYGLEHHRDKLRDPYAEMAQLYIERRAELDEIWLRGPTTVLQGDSHVGNLFLDAHRVGFLDWGLIQLGTPMRDVGYFITMALSPEDRRAHERELIQRYLAARTEVGGDTFDFDEAWMLHRVHAAYAAPASCPLVLFPEDEPEENKPLSRSFLERSQCVIEDLDARSALREFAGL
jgi:aminoglycoside phosphotransferase (APT) family kinase protein